MKIYGYIKQLVELWYSKDGQEVKLKPNANTYSAATDFSLPPRQSGSGVLVGESETQTLTNKTLTSPTITGGSFSPVSLTVKDNAFTIQDNVDNTKQALFEASGITAGQTRTFSLPDASTTLVGTGTAQSLTNKVIDGDDNSLSDISISSLKTSLPDANQLLMRNASGVVVDELLTNVNVAAAAGIDASKIADGSVSSTEFQYLNTVTSNVQTQLDGKQPLDSDLTAVAGLTGNGIVVRQSTGVATTRAIQAGTGVVVSNNDGVSGNPTIAADPTVVATLTGTQSLTNKTLVTPVIDNGAVFAQETAVGTPASGFISLYPKADNRLYILDSSGLEVPVGSASGSGEKNYITQGNNNATGWSASAAGIVVATESTVANLPDNATQVTGVRITRVSGGDYVVVNNAGPARPRLDDVDAGKKLKVQFDQRYAGTQGDYTVRVFAFAAATGGVGTEIPVAGGSIPAGLGQKQITFDSFGIPAALPFIEVRIYGVSGTTPLYLNNFLVGPGQTYLGAAVGSETSYTPTFASGFGTPTGVVFSWRRVGDKMHIAGKFTAGTISSATASFTLPPGYTIGGSTQLSGKWARGVAGANAVKQGTFIGVAGGSLIFFGLDDYTAAAGPDSAQNCNVIATTGNAFYIDGEIIVPIAEWAGQGTVNMGAGAQPSFASNSSTSTVSDTTSFQYGEDGALVQAFAPAGTASVDKRVRSPYPNPKFAVVQVKPANRGWVSLGDALPQFSSNDAGSTYYGVLITPVSGSTTDFDVSFYSAVIPGVTWSAVSSGGYRWRVVFADTPAAVGFGLATATDSGLLPAYNTISGRYTPTVTNGVNVSASTPQPCAYSRLGNIVTVSGRVDVTTTAAANTLTVLTLTLPINSNLTLNTDLSGSGGRSAPSGTASQAAFIEGDVATDRAVMYFASSVTTNNSLHFVFQYEVK